MKEEEKAKELQERYMEYQMLHEQVRQVQHQLNKLEHQLVELDKVMKGLENLGASKAGDELLAPISNGIFLKTSIKSNDELLVNVGANTVVKKTRADTIGLLSRQRELMAEHVRQGQLQLSMMMDNLQKVEKELKSMAE